MVTKSLESEFVTRFMADFGERRLKCKENLSHSLLATVNPK